MCDIVITNHAYKRAKGRFSLSKISLVRLAQTAFLDGIHPEKTKGPLKKFIQEKMEKYSDSNNIRVYGENVFIFIDNRLITLYRLPNELVKIALKQR